MKHLQKLHKQPHITIQMLPFTNTNCIDAIGSFGYLEFAGEEMDYVTSTSSTGSTKVATDNPEQASKYIEAFAAIQAASSAPEDLDTYIDRALAELPAETP